MSFRPRQKSPSVYFNDGEASMSVQQPKDILEPNPRLVKAIKAAWSEFNHVYFDKPADKAKGGAR